MNEYVIMPDHMHAIIRIGNIPGRGDPRVILWIGLLSRICWGDRRVALLTKLCI
jgi:hypothetical protein